jgi:hypothetical protein
MKMQMFECCLCGEHVNQWPNNPEPFGTPGQRCCADCDYRWVTPARVIFGYTMDGESKRLFTRFARLAHSFVKMAAVAKMATERTGK